MSSAFYKAQFTQFSCVCCFAGFFCHFPVNLLEYYRDTYWKDIRRNWLRGLVISCCSTVRFHFLEGLFSLHFRNMSKKKSNGAKVNNSNSANSAVQISLFSNLWHVAFAHPPASCPFSSNNFGQLQDDFCLNALQYFRHTTCNFHSILLLQLLLQWIHRFCNWTATIFIAWRVRAPIDSSADMEQTRADNFYSAACFTSHPKHKASHTVSCCLVLRTLICKITQNVGFLCST